MIRVRKPLPGAVLGLVVGLVGCFIALGVYAISCCLGAGVGHIIAVALGNETPVVGYGYVVGVIVCVVGSVAIVFSIINNYYHNKTGLILYSRFSVLAVVGAIAYMLAFTALDDGSGGYMRKNFFVHAISAAQMIPLCVLALASPIGCLLAGVLSALVISFKSALVGIVLFTVIAAVSLDIVDFIHAYMNRYMSGGVMCIVRSIICIVLETGTVHYIWINYTWITNNYYFGIQVFVAFLIGAITGDVIAQVYRPIAQGSAAASDAARTSADAAHANADDDSIGSGTSVRSRGGADIGGPATCAVVINTPPGISRPGAGVVEGQSWSHAAGSEAGHNERESQDKIRQNPGVAASTQHGVPTLKDLMEKVAVKLSDEWQQLGIQLNLDQELLRRIELTTRDTLGCCREMFNQWLRKEHDPSWDKIIKALKTQSVDRPRLARDLEAHRN